MAVTRTGAIQNIQDGADASSRSITVPADAELAIVTIAGWSNEITKASAAAFTLGAAGFTLAHGELDDPSDGNQAAIFYLVSPPTGTQTLAWNLGGSAAWGDGGQINVAFYKGVNLTTPIGDVGGGSVISGTGAVSDTLVAANGDAIIACCYAYNTAVTWTGLTEINDATFNGSFASCAEGFPTGNQTFSVVLTGGTSGWKTASAVVIQQAAGGGSTPKSGTDANGTTTDTASESAAYTGAEVNGATTETPTAQVFITTSDANGTITEISSSASPVSASDSGTDVETGTPRGVISGSETGSGTDTGTNNTPVTASDTGVGTDASVGKAVITGSDSNLSSDTGLEVFKPTVTDTGSAVETQSAGVPVNGADSGSGSDVTALSVALNGLETGFGTETLFLRVLQAVADAGITSDISNIRFITFVMDGNSGTEIVSIGLIVADSGSDFENASHVDSGVQISVSDFGILVDAGVVGLVPSGRFRPQIIEAVGQGVPEIIGIDAGGDSDIVSVTPGVLPKPQIQKVGG